jgi:hypothetical protein
MDTYKELIAQRAKDEMCSENEIVERALALYLSKDTMEESLLIAKMSEILRQIGYLQRKIDVGQKLTLEWYQYFFMYAPGLPTDQSERDLQIKKANNRVQAFLLNFRHKASKIKPFIETIFGDMLEEDTEVK